MDHRTSARNIRFMDSAYARLAILLSINALLMFLITFANIDSLSHFHVNVNRVYMALLMVMPMLLLMLGFMGSMYPDKTVNVALAVAGALALALLFGAIRTQAVVNDRQFLRSMIPHHSSAIVMCERSSLTDAEIKELCGEIVRTQKEEIAQMERILERLR